MPSRKRSKAKARKAKKQGIVAVETEKCSHGCPPPPTNSTTNLIVDDFLIGYKSALNLLVSTSDSPYDNFERVSAYVMAKKACPPPSAIDHIHPHLISMGTDLLLQGGDKQFAMAAATLYAAALLLPPTRGNPSSVRDKLNVANLLRDLEEESERTIIRYFSKRIPCSCLKSMFEIAIHHQG